MQGGLHAASSVTTEVQTYSLRCMRFLFSVERNRKLFKRIFPADFFAAFIDIGHYVWDSKPYHALTQLYNELPWSTKASIIASLESVKAFHNNNKGNKQVIHGYVIQEILGKGAFGTVYQVQKENGEKCYAMKELSLLGVQALRNNTAQQHTMSSQNGGGAADTDVKRAIADMCAEVEILSQLDHPNIVRYYTSFVEGNNIYIIMELIEGGSLLDHIQSLVEKGQRMQEQHIWPIFIQVCLALCYMHMEKRVVHRDLTPANVMIGELHALVFG